MFHAADIIRGPRSVVKYTLLRYHFDASASREPLVHKWEHVNLKNCVYEKGITAFVKLSVPQKVKLYVR